MSPRLEIEATDYWNLAVFLKNLPQRAGSAALRLTVTQPNGYRQEFHRKVELDGGEVRQEIVHPLLDDGTWAGPTRSGGDEEVTPGWDHRWVMGSYRFTARVEIDGGSPLTLFREIDVYDFYQVPENHPTAMHSHRQILECSPLAPVCIDVEKAGFHMRTIRGRETAFEVEADVVAAGTEDRTAGPWRTKVTSRKSVKRFSIRGWPRGDYWIRVRAIREGKPVGSYCIRLFTNETGGPSILQPSEGAEPVGTGTLFMTDDTFFGEAAQVRFRPQPLAKTPDRPLFDADKPWELPSLGIEEISYDEKTGEYRLIYTTSSSRPGYKDDHKKEMQFARLLAVSTDGIDWQKPELGKVDFRGSKKNNILSNQPPRRLYGKFDDASDEAKHLLEHATFRYYNPDHDGPIDVGEITFPAWKRKFPEACKSIQAARESGDAALFNGWPRGFWPLVKRGDEFLVLSDRPLVYGGVGQDLLHCTESVRGSATLDGGRARFFYYRPTPPGYAPHWMHTDNLCRGRRCAAVFWTEDGFNWNRRFVLGPDEFDDDATVFYSMRALIPRGSELHAGPIPADSRRGYHGENEVRGSPMYLGSVLHYDLVTGKLWPELTWSRDLVRWKRFNKERAPLIATGEPGSYCGGWCRDQHDISYQFGDEWWFPYSASHCLHYTSFVWLFDGDMALFKKRFPNYLRDRGLKSWEEAYTLKESHWTFPAVARCKAGRVAYAEPADGAGGMTSVPMVAGGDAIALNAEVAPGGRIRVEVQDEQGHALPGYGRADCVPVTGDGISQRVAWRSGSREGIEGRSVRVRVELERAKLFAFRFQG